MYNGPVVQWQDTPLARVRSGFNSRQVHNFFKNIFKKNIIYHNKLFKTYLLSSINKKGEKKRNNMAKKRKQKKNSEEVFEIPDLEYLEQEQEEETDKEAIRRYIG